jgi:hypothetical protein
MGFITNNCFLLLIPILVWNFGFNSKLIKVGYLTDAEGKKTIGIIENILRALIFLYPLFMRFEVKASDFIRNIIIYSVGSIIYFLTWIMIIYFKNNKWSVSRIGLLAPAYTPLIWLIAIGLLGESIIYICMSTVFIAVHTYHTYIKLNENK